jgi:hypothetical protein
MEETSGPTRPENMTTNLPVRLWWVAFALAIMATILLGSWIDSSTTPTDPFYHRPGLDP